MNVTINGKNQKYVVRADKHQFVLIEINIVKEGGKAGQEVEGQKRFYPLLEQLVDKIYHLELADSDCEALQDMLKCILATRRLVRTAGLTKEDF